MRTYSSEDQRNLTNLVDELLTENWFDRAKARGAQAIGAIKGTKDLAKGIGYSVKSGFDDSGESYNKSREYIKSSVGSKDNAKIGSYLKSVNSKVENVRKEVMSDLSKLNINIPENQKLLINKAFDMLVTQFDRALNNLKYVGSGASTPAPAPSPAPSPTPASTPAPASSPSPAPAATTPAKKTAKKTPTPAKKTAKKTPTPAKKTAKKTPTPAKKTTNKRPTK